jgi:hypothetical protein
VGLQRTEPKTREKEKERYLLYTWASVSGRAPGAVLHTALKTKTIAAGNGAQLKGC